MLKISREIRNNVFGQVLDGLTFQVTSRLKGPIWDQVSNDVYHEVNACIKNQLANLNGLALAGEFWIYFDRQGPRINPDGTFEPRPEIDD